MAVPASIKAEIAALQAAFVAATPLAQAPRASIRALQIKAGQLVADIDAAIVAAVGALDGFQSSATPDATAVGLQTLLGSAQAQSDLVALRGLVGRVAANLNQV